jgi:hypothetical protein
MSTSSNIPSTSLAGAEWLTEGTRPHQALDQLLRRPDAAKLVRSTQAQPLFLFIKSLGLADATELLALCSTQQLQAFLDMDAWEGDRVAPARFYPWLEALLELGVQKTGAHVRRLDPELLTTFLSPRLHVYELTDEEPPDEPLGRFYATPDRFYMLDILPDPDGDEDRPALLQRFFDTLYRADLELARTIVQSARWDAGAPAEESAYRFRSARMADLGYIEYYEALKIYMLLDPQAPPPPSELAASKTAPIIDEGTRALVFAPGLEDVDGTFNRAATYLPEGERSQLFQQLLLMANRVMAADRIELGDATAARTALRRTAGYLSLGLEFRLLPAVAGGRSQAAQPVQINIAQAAQVLRETSLLYLFRLGYSLTVQLRKLASLLVEGHEAGLTTLSPQRDPASLLPPRLSEPLRGILLLRPLYSGYLDATVRPASPLSVVPPLRPFGGLRELSRAAAFLADLSTLGKFLTTGLGLRRDNLVEVLGSTTPNANDVQLSDLLGTMIANLLLLRPPVLVPIARRDLPALRHTAWSDKATLIARLEARVRERALGESEVALLWSAPSMRLVDETLEALGRSLGSLPEALSPELADVVTRLDGLVLH